MNTLNEFAETRRLRLKKDAFSKDRQPPFSMRGLEIPEQDKLEMALNSENQISYSFDEAEKSVRSRKRF